MKKRMGRPPGPESERLKHTVHPRLSDPVFDAFDSVARATGESINTIARKVLTAAAPRLPAILNGRDGVSTLD